MSLSAERDRRTGKDRRNKPTSPLTRTSLFGSRMQPRREEDIDVHFHVDRYSYRSVVIVLATIFLSIADGFFTLHLVANGAEEINPVMAFFLQFGSLPFLLTKYCLTAGCLIVFLIYKNFKMFGRVPVKSLLLTAFLIYILLILYELFLVMTKFS